MRVVPGIYTPLPAENGELCHPIQADGFHLLTELCNENSRAGTWVPPAMELIDADEGKPLRRTDAPWCSSSSMVFRSTVLDKLGDLLTAAGKVLPLACPGHEL